MNNRIVVVGSINADLNVLVDRHQVGGQAGLGRQFHHTTPWPTERDCQVDDFFGTVLSYIRYLESEIENIDNISKN